MAVIDRAEDFGKWQGRLKGKVVLATRTTTVNPLFTATGRRLTDQELLDMQSQPVNAGRGRGGAPRPIRRPTPNFARQRMQFFAREGVVAVLEPGNGRNDHGAIIVQGPNQNRDPKEPPTAAQIVVASEHYNRIARLLDRKMPVTIELNVTEPLRGRHPQMPLNVIAEIPGTDRPDEVVMLGAHFDSWHAGTGATDNGAGSAAMMEAMRILKTTGLRMRRTVRLALWTGEEQGLLGSRAYVKQHFGDRDTMQLKAGARDARGLLQHGQRHRRDSRRVPAGKRSGSPDLCRVDGAVPQPGDDDPDDQGHGVDRPCAVRRGGSAGLSVHPGSGGVQHPLAPHEHGSVRSHPGART